MQQQTQGSSLEHDFGTFIMAIDQDQNPPPHVNIRYLEADDDALVDIATGGLLEGQLPPGKEQMIRQFLREHGDNLTGLFYHRNPHLNPPPSWPSEYWQGKG